MCERQNLVKSQYSETWLNDGVVYQMISPQIFKVNLEIAKQLVEDRKQASGDFVKLPVIVFLNNATNIQNEAKKFYRTTESYENITALALVMDNYTARLVATLVFNIQKPIIPTNVFNSEQKARKWLQKFMPLN